MRNFHPSNAVLHLFDLTTSRGPARPLVLSGATARRAPTIQRRREARDAHEDCWTYAHRRFETSPLSRGPCTTPSARFVSAVTASRTLQRKTATARLAYMWARSASQLAKHCTPFSHCGGTHLDARTLSGPGHALSSARARRYLAGLGVVGLSGCRKVAAAYTLQWRPSVRSLQRRHVCLASSGSGRYVLLGIVWPTI